MINNTINNGMIIALKEAQKAYDAHEVPVGACLFYDNQCIARAYNTMHGTQNPLYHAEYQVLLQALRILSPYEMRKSTLFVTLEPCCMCAGALELLGVPRIYFGAYDIKMGQIDHNNRVLDHTSIQAWGGFHEEACGHLLRQFFQNKRG